MGEVGWLGAWFRWMGVAGSLPDDPSESSSGRERSLGLCEGGEGGEGVRVGRVSNMKWLD